MKVDFLVLDYLSNSLVELDADKPQEANTITKVTGNVEIVTPALSRKPERSSN